MAQGDGEKPVSDSAVDIGAGNPGALRQYDALEAVRLERANQGEFAISMLARLLDGLPEHQPSQVQWAAQGVQSPLGRQQLHLQVSASIRLVCQRCLQVFEQPLQSSVVLDLVATEAELDDPDDAADAGAGQSVSADDDATPVDRIVCRGRLDLLAQIEDELILSLPYIAHHEVCPEPLPQSAGEDMPDTGRRHPFAALAELRKTDAEADTTEQGTGKRQGKPGRSGPRS